MKKVYVMISLLGVIALAGCTFKAPEMPVLTWDVQELTGTETMTGITITGDNTMEEFTGEMEGEELLLISTDSTPVSTIVEPKTVEETWVTTEVKTLIDDRQDQPKDTTKLTEEDIDLMDQIIQKIKNL